MLDILQNGNDLFIRGVMYGSYDGLLNYLKFLVVHFCYAK